MPLPKQTNKSVPVTKSQLLMFWDYDTQWGADRSRSDGGAKDWGYLEFENSDRLLEIYDEYEMKACFAVVGAAALEGEHPYHDPKQIRRIHAQGHEIASHSMYHDWLPALDYTKLTEDLWASKDALEQCIGHSVTAFIPPYNQPFDYWQKMSISLSERREVGVGRTDLTRLCSALAKIGYKFARVAYRPMWQRLAEKIYRTRLDNPSEVEMIKGIHCLRLNTPGGFDAPVQTCLKNFIDAGKKIVVYAHPHSLTSNNSQNEAYLLEFLEIVRDYRQAGQLEVCLPRDLLESRDS